MLPGSIGPLTRMFASCMFRTKKKNIKYSYTCQKIYTTIYRYGFYFMVLRLHMEESNYEVSLQIGNNGRISQRFVKINRIGTFRLRERHGQPFKS